jgi:hypothetical protein
MSMPDLAQIDSIRELQQQGAIAEALGLCTEALVGQPDSAALLALAGVLSCQLQEFDCGRKYLDSLRSAQSAPFDPDTLTDIAAIHLLVNEPLN